MFVRDRRASTVNCDGLEPFCGSSAISRSRAQPFDLPSLVSLARYTKAGIRGRRALFEKIHTRNWCPEKPFGVNTRVDFVSCASFCYSFPIPGSRGALRFGLSDKTNIIFLSNTKKRFRLTWWRNDVVIPRRLIFIEKLWSLTMWAVRRSNCMNIWLFTGDASWPFWLVTYLGQPSKEGASWFSLLLSWRRSKNLLHSSTFT